MSSGRRTCHVALSLLRPLVLTLCLLTSVVQPVAAAAPAVDGQTAPTAELAGSYLQQGAGNETGSGAATATTTATGNETSASSSGIVGTITGFLGGIAGFVGGVLGAIFSFFVDHIIGQAIIGLTLGVLIGLKLIAIYIEQYEE
ncbi:hypothetical protein ACFR9U_09020 [Halorientalis brevis]|uniref:Uncharacterized protein n=1 Tax=Halorientalis brevis TaxID=1126241 RepID=A0ABD6CC43_9EURY|nr:hypothetical protein [Halorientalis brevis]